MANTDLYIPTPQQSAASQRKGAADIDAEVQKSVNTARESAIDTVKRQTMNVGQVFQNEVLAGLDVPAYAIGKTALDYAQGKAQPGGFVAAYRSNDAAIVEELRKSREELGWAGELATATAAGLSPLSVGKKLDTAFDATSRLADQLSPTKMAKWVRASKAALLGGSANVMQGYLSGERSFDDALYNGGFGAAMGGVLQRLVGDDIGPKAAQVVSERFGSSPTGDLLTSVADDSMDPNSMNLHQMARNVDNGAYGDDGSFLATQIGDAPISRQWQRMNEYIGDLVFGGTDVRDLNTPEGEAMRTRYAAVVSAVNRAAESVHEQATTKFRNAVGDPVGRKEALVGATSQRKAANMLYKKINNMEPDPMQPDKVPLGATPVDTQLLMADITSTLPGKYGRAAAGSATAMENAPPAALEMHNRFSDLIRGRHQEAMAKDYVNIPVARSGRAGGSTDLNEIFQKDMPLARLMDARKGLANMLSPSGAFNSGIDKEKRLAGKHILDMVDARIATATVGESVEARKAFSDSMRMEEAFDLGRKFYAQRMGEHNGKDGFNELYGETLEEARKNMSPDVRQLFELGGRQGMLDAVGKSGFMREMQNLVGHYDARIKDGSFYTTKKQGLDEVRALLGDGADDVLKLFEEGYDTEAAVLDLMNTLAAKGVRPKDAVGVASMLKEAVPSKTKHVKFYTDQLAPVVKWMTHPRDTKKALAALDLMGARGSAVSGTLAEGIERAAGGFPRSAGARAGMITPSAAEDRKTSVAEAGSDIASYLRQRAN